jgi:hypothetical protein
MREYHFQEKEILSKKVSATLLREHHVQKKGPLSKKTSAPLLREHHVQKKESLSKKASAPLFIIGLGRSGTTLLRLMLNQHPRIAIPYESHFITKYCIQIDSYGDLEADNNLRKLVSDILSEPFLKMWDHQFDVDRIIAAVEIRSLRGVLEYIYQEYAKSKGKVRWGDKSSYLDDLPHVNELFPDAKFIHIIRDGRDVARSVLKMPWGPTDLIAAANWWSDNVRVCRRMGAILGKERYTEVLFEELIQNTEGELQRLCEFIDEEYSPIMLEYYKNAERSIPLEMRAQHYNTNTAPQKSRTFSWKKEMNSSDIKIFDRFGGQMLEELGYERPELKVNKIKIMLKLLRIAISKFYQTGL